MSENLRSAKAEHTSTSFRGRARPLVTAGTALMSDEVREEISQDPEQRQPGDAIGGENPGAAAFTPASSWVD